MHALSDLPQKPCVYALIGGRGGNKYVAYVGIAGKLRSRIAQHLVLRDSSVTTGTSAAMLNPDYVTEIRWWHSPIFEDKVSREAAEIIAIDILNPDLRSRGRATEEAKFKAQEKHFSSKMNDIFYLKPSGSLEIFSMQDVIEKLAELEKRIFDLETGQIVR